jgi:hypothetical protein
MSLLYTSRIIPTTANATSAASGCAATNVLLQALSGRMNDVGIRMAGDGGQPAEPVPAPAAKGAPVDMTEAGVMKNQLPRAIVAQTETSMTQLSAPTGADNFAG